MTRLILVRHAEAEGNQLQVFQGRTDVDLTEKGRQQAILLEQRLKSIPIDLIYSSPLKRAIQTAEFIGQNKKIPIIYTDSIQEIYGGDWDNKSWKEIIKRWPVEYRTWIRTPHQHVMPNGESMDELRTRLVFAIDNIVCENRNKHAEKNIAIITHAAALRVLISVFYGYPLQKLNEIKWHANTAVSIVEVDENGKYQVVLEGDEAHLSLHADKR